MKTFDLIQPLKTIIEDLKNKNKKIAFVPTMGNLHDGHLSLVKKAKAVSDVVIVSIFINPLQFSQNEDLKNYPKSLKDDLIKLEKLEADIVFTPSELVIYPKGKNNAPRIYIKQFESMLCALSRPDFFSGIATVVAILFNIIEPDVAVFGEKDYQQLLVIKKLVQDLHFNIEIIASEIIREKSGLAMSSRNNYFDNQQKKDAAQLFTEIQILKNKIKESKNQSIELSELISNTKNNLTLKNFKVDYLEIRSEDNLALIENKNELLNKKCRIFTACIFNNVRLIDNLRV